MRITCSTRPTHRFAPSFVKRCVAAGAGPNAALALLLGAKTNAILAGRFAITLGDIQAVALPVLRHRIVLGPQTIGRYNNYRTMTVLGSPKPGQSSGDALAAMEQVSARTLPAGYDFEWTDTSYQEKLAAGQTGPILALAVLFAYLFLVGLYESWVVG